MITYYSAAKQGLARHSGLDDPDHTLWVDLFSLTPQELERLSARLGLRLPTKEDQDEIEHSSRLYFEEGFPVMTTLLPSSAETGEMRIGPVSFVLLADRLITLRHHAPRPFDTYPSKAASAGPGCASPEAILVGLFEEIIDRLADITEQTGREIDTVSRGIFGAEQSRADTHRTALRAIGRADTNVMQLRESLMSVERLLGFLIPIMDGRKVGRGLRGALKSQIRDVRTISEQAGFLQQKTAFMLDAVLGLINIDQNAIIKIFSVVAVAFLPPTLVASAYGMNFAHMPELDWPWGYPFALGLMALSAVVPLWFFRRRGWL